MESHESHDATAESHNKSYVFLLSTQLPSRRRLKSPLAVALQIPLSAEGLRFPIVNHTSNHRVIEMANT